MKPEKFVLDGELIVTEKRTLDLDALLQRMHPAESRITKLAKETPVTLVLFDLLVNERGEDFSGRGQKSGRKTARSPKRSVRVSPR